MEAAELIELMRDDLANRRDTQAGFARLLGIHPTAISKLLAGKRLLKSSEADILRRWYGLRDSEEQEKPRLLPIVGLVAAGAWREGFENIMGYMPSPDPSLSKDAFVVVVEGDSMDLIAKHGESIIVDPADRSLVAGGFYVIRNSDGESTFKQYREAPARLEPCSSSNEYAPIYPGQEEFTVIGRARLKVVSL